MLKVTVELIPNGDESKKETISEVFISNTLERSPFGGEGYIYNYDGWMNSNYREVEVGDLVHHNRNDHVWYLIRNVAITIVDNDIVF